MLILADAALDEQSHALCIASMYPPISDPYLEVGDVARVLAFVALGVAEADVTWERTIAHCAA